MKNRFKVVSLFSGCGGLDLGFVGGFEFLGKFYQKSGFDIIWANDFDKDAQLTYKLNSHYLGDHHLDLRDIWEVTSQEVPDCDVLLAGFPCQPFSNAGNRRGVKDPRGTLFVACENLIREMVERSEGKFPKAFVFENVRGITSSKMDDGTPVPEEIKKRMLALGFHTEYKLIKASNYGVPQQRFRVIFVGTRSPGPKFNFRMLDEVKDQNKIPSENNGSLALCLGNVLKNIPFDRPNYNDIWNLSESAIFMVSRIGKCEGDIETFQQLVDKSIDKTEIPKAYLRGRSWKNVNPDEMPSRFLRIWRDPKRYRAPNFYRRFALGEVCGTITASAQPENCGIVHPHEDRRFSVREIARLQSFPDDFVFGGTSVPSMYKLIGNAVPPVLGWVISRALEKHLLLYEDKFTLPLSSSDIGETGRQLQLL